jgi:peptidoglycan/LPS O-acetylase OafA/YrhL
MPALTGLRFLAAMIVFVNHSGLENVYPSARANFLITGLSATVGEAAVGFFFMLSGLVLTISAPPGDTPLRFLRRRAVKILPNHALTWTAGLLLMITAGEFTRWGTVLPSLFLVHVWAPVVDVVSGTDGPAWSLACELVFYLSFPWLLPLLGRIREQRLGRWLAGLAAGVVAVPFVASLLPDHPTLFGLPASVPQLWFTVFLPPVRMLDFALGIVAARLMLCGRWRQPRLWVTVTALLVAWLASLAIPVPYNLMAPFVVPVLLVLGAGARAHGGWVGGRWLVRLGEASFAFYLIHWLVLHYAHVALGGGAWSPLAATGYLLGALATSTALALAIFTWFERPLVRRFSRPRPPRAPGPEAPADATPATHAGGPAASLTPAPVATSGAASADASVGAVAARPADERRERVASG